MVSSSDDKDAIAPPSAGPQMRRATFLVRYKRKFKIGVCAGILFAVIVVPHLINDVQTWLAAPDRIAKPAISKDVIPQLDKDVALPDSITQTQADNAPSASASMQPALNDQNDQSIKLVAAPIPALSEDTPQGSLPRIGEDGSQPWQAYARPFNTADKRPRIALVVLGMGLQRLSTNSAIDRMPPPVTLAFDLESPNLNSWFDRARQSGHETILTLPMEPFDYPRSDPGPHTLLTNLSNSDNAVRLLRALGQGSGYVGVTTVSGSRFTTDPEKLTPMLEIIQKRGLMILDTRVAPHSAVMDLAHNMHIPAVIITSRIDQNLAPEAIDAALTQLEQTARVNGFAIGLASPVPLTLNKLEAWLKDLPQRGIALAPLSAMVQ